VRQTHSTKILGSPLKTLLINNFTSLKSLRNCEAYDTERTIDNLKQFITGVAEPDIQNKPMDFGLSSFFLIFHNLKQHLLVK